MKNILKIVSFIAFVTIGVLGFAQERTHENERVDDEKVVREVKKEQKEYEKEHGEVLPQNKQDPNPKPVVKSNDKLAKKDKSDKKSDDFSDDDDSDDEGFEKDKTIKIKKEKKVEKVKSNNGNAYGKEKGDLSGREFGQARATEARNKINDYQSQFDDRQLFVRKSQERIADAKKRLDADRSAGKFTDEQLADREQRIQRAEIQLENLRESLQAAKERLNKQKENLAKIYENDNDDN